MSDLIELEHGALVLPEGKFDQPEINWESGIRELRNHEGDCCGFGFQLGWSELLGEFQSSGCFRQITQLEDPIFVSLCPV